MKILHINCNYLGSALHQLMIENLEGLGVENEVFVPVYDKTRSVIEPNENVYVSECFNKWDRIVFDYKQNKIIKAIEDHYDVKSFDLIHAYTLFTDGNAARVLSQKYGVPYVVAIRNTDVYDFFRKMIHLRGRGIRTMLLAERVFFLSESYKNTVFQRYIRKKYQYDISKKTVIIPNGIDDFWFDNEYAAKRVINSDQINLVYAGGIDKNKNITATQSAMQILEKKNINTRLTIVGKVIDRKEFEKVCMNDNTAYIPAKPKEELIEVYRDNDIFVMPSIHESFGLVYAEAMTQGLPVIYSKGQGFDGQFKDGEVGFAVESKSPVDIADKISKVIEQYNRLSQNTNELAKKFMWKQIVRNYYDIYCVTVKRT